MSPWIVGFVLIVAGFSTTSGASEVQESCSFGSPSDFLSEEFVNFDVKGWKVFLSDKTLVTPQRAYPMEECNRSAEIGCISTSFFSLAMPSRQIGIDDTWIFGSETYRYEENAQVRVFGKTETFGVISRRSGGLLVSQFLVNNLRGLAAIIKYVRGEDGELLGRVQVYLQDESCHPFPIHLEAPIAPQNPPPKASKPERPSSQ